MWKEVWEEDPDIWIWLEDNIYTDTDDPKVLKKKYKKQSENSLYQKLKQNTTIYGTWDDHDFGYNDSGREHSVKRESQQKFLDFMNLAIEDSRREKEGIYHSLT